MNEKQWSGWIPQVKEDAGRSGERAMLGRGAHNLSTELEP